MPRVLRVELCLALGNELAISRARHSDVDVVIPRYESTVPDSPQERSVYEIVAELVDLANANELLEDAQFCQLARP